MARKGAATLLHLLNKFTKWNGIAYDVLISTMNITGPLTFEDSLMHSGDIVYSIPSRLLEIGIPITKCTMSHETGALRNRFPHSYAVHHFDGSWVSYKPSCFFTSAWVGWRDNVDAIAFGFGFIIVLLLIAILVISINHAKTVHKLNVSSAKMKPSLNV